MGIFTKKVKPAEPKTSISAEEVVDKVYDEQDLELETMEAPEDINLVEVKEASKVKKEVKPNATTGQLQTKDEALTTKVAELKEQINNRFGQPEVSEITNDQMVGAIQILESSINDLNERVKSIESILFRRLN